MKTILAFFLLFVLVFSCKKEDKSTVVTLSGVATNSKSDSVFIVGENFRKGIPISDGNFSDTLSIATASFYQLYLGNERTLLYLTPGDDLTITVDVEQFDESLRYGGTSAKENNYLAIKYLMEEKIMADPESLFTLDSEDFITKLGNIKADFEEDLDQAKLSAKFTAMQKKNLHYDYLLYLNEYPDYHHYFTGKEVELSKDFRKEMQAFDPTNEHEFEESPSFKSLVLFHYFNEIGDPPTVESLRQTLHGIPSQKIKNEILKSMLYFVSDSNPDSEAFVNLIKEYGKDEKLVNQATEKLQAIQSLLPGKPSPVFRYDDVNGKSVSLQDLKGNLVYVDVWATWCAPCLQEIPALKKLETDFHGKGITFVSLSIDEKADFEKWKKMVVEKDLQGVQLFADDAWRSDFVRAYAIDAIPRFILIDTYGNIINSNAPRPSDPSLKEQLKELL